MMWDFGMFILTGAFFVIALLYVTACERLR